MPRARLGKPMKFPPIAKTKTCWIPLSFLETKIDVNDPKDLKRIAKILATQKVDKESPSGKSWVRM